MSTRDDCLQQAAQHAVDGWQRLHELVRQVGPDEAARLVHYPGHGLTQAQIAERLRPLAATEKGRQGAA